jgi:hypothetical protein
MVDNFFLVVEDVFFWCQALFDAESIMYLPWRKSFREVIKFFMKFYDEKCHDKFS